MSKPNHRLVAGCASGPSAVDSNRTPDANGCRGEPAPCGRWRTDVPLVASLSAPINCSAGHWVARRWRPLPEWRGSLGFKAAFVAAARRSRRIFAWPRREVRLNYQGEAAMHRHRPVGRQLLSSSAAKVETSPPELQRALSARQCAVAVLPEDTIAVAFPNSDLRPFLSRLSPPLFRRMTRLSHLQNREYAHLHAD